MALMAIALLPLWTIAACGSTPTQPQPPPVIDPDPDPDPDPEPEPPKPTLTVTRILAFGDSLTEGLSDGLPLSPWSWGGVSSHVNKSTSYPMQLKELIKERYANGNSITVVNAGVGGEHLTGATKDRIETEIDDHNPDVLLLLHGVNDLNGGVTDQQGGSSITDEEIVQDVSNRLDELIELAKDIKPGIRILLATLPPQKTGTSSKTKAAHLVPAYNDELKLIAKEEKCVLVDLFTALNKNTDLTPDGLHITEAGNLKMAQAFLAKLKAYEKAPQ